MILIESIDHVVFFQFVDLLLVLPLKFTFKQENSPVECVLPAFLVRGGADPSDAHPPQADVPVNRMTDRCKNITLPQTSFAGGKYRPAKKSFGI